MEQVADKVLQIIGGFSFAMIGMTLVACGVFLMASAVIKLIR